jgi:arsenate reductase
MSIQILHNSRCSKSRAALDLLKTNKLDFQVIEYLKTPLNKAQITLLLAQLCIPAAALIRKSEAIYKSDYKGKTLSENDWIEAMVAHPKLIERPIVIVNDKAAIGRPIENIQALLGE